MKVKLIAISVGLACAAAVPVAHATNGYMSHAYSPASKGMSGAGEAALPQDSLSLVGNPAGLTRIGQRLDFGAAWFSPIRSYDGLTPDLATGAYAPIGGGLDGKGEVESENTDFLIPNFGYTHQLDADSAVGVALFGNGGMNSDYRSKDTLFGLGTFGGNNSLFNPPANTPTTFKIGGGNSGVNLEQLGLSLGYARDIGTNFSLGGSLLLAYQTIEVKGVGAFQGFTETFTQSALANNPISPSNLSDNGDDSSYGWGVQIGALWDVNPMVTLGASIRSKMYMTEFDKYSDLFAEGGDFDIPAVGTIGLAFKPTQQLTFAFDVQQIWYGDVAAVANDNELAVKCNIQNNMAGYDASYCLGGSNGTGFGWSDMTVLKFGVQYLVNDQWKLRAGYSHGNQPISSSQMAFNTLAPAVIEDTWSIGATYRMAQNYELTFWGSYMPEETVTGSGTFMGTQSPDIRMKQYEIGINFGWLFN